MANEYRTSEGVFNNTPLEDIFDPRGSLTKIPDVGIRVAGSDISNLYAPIGEGSATTATGIRSGGADLNTLFAGIGTVTNISLITDSIGSFIVHGISPVGTAVAGISLEAGGLAQKFAVMNYGQAAQFFNLNGPGNYWMDPPGDQPGANFEVFASITSSGGAGIATGTYGTWQSLSFTRSWSRTLSTVGTGNMQIFLFIRNAATLTTLATANFFISVGQET